MKRSLFDFRNVSGQEYRNLREDLGWTQEQCGAYFGKTGRTIREHESDRMEIPGAEIVALRLLWQLQERWPTIFRQLTGED